MSTLCHTLSLDRVEANEYKTATMSAYPRQTFPVVLGVAAVLLIRSRRRKHRTRRCRAILTITARADVEYGARLYAQHCFGCHGNTGDGVAGVDLRSGKFRNATTDPQLRTVISNGFPNAGMPAFKLDAAELTGVVAYIRNMNTFDASSMKAGNAGERQDGLRGQGRVPELSSRQQHRQPQGA